MRRVVRRALRVVGFALFYVGNLMSASFVVAREVLTPRLGIRPAIVEVPIEATSDLEVALLANLISLTPGTLTLDAPDDRRSLFVHAMHVSSPDDLRADIARLESRLLRALR